MDADPIQAHWFKSRYSESNAQCVEIAHFGDGAVGVRDSNNPTGPALVFAPTAWDAFTMALSSGKFGRP